jgi:hypothetical protein
VHCAHVADVDEIVAVVVLPDECCLLLGKLGARREIREHNENVIEEPERHCNKKQRMRCDCFLFFLFSRKKKRKKKKEEKKRRRSRATDQASPRADSAERSLR